MSKIDGEIVARAAELADANLFPGALAVDAKGEVPVAALDLVCGAGFHGLFHQPSSEVWAHRLKLSGPFLKL